MAPDKCYTFLLAGIRSLCLFLLFLSFFLIPVSSVFWSTSSSTSSSIALQDTPSTNELHVTFNIYENLPIGTFIGIIQSNDSSVTIEPPFLIVPFGDSDESSSISVSGSINSRGSILETESNSDNTLTSCNVDTELNIDQSTGEIRSAVELDRERCSRYSFIAISLTGVNIHVVITIDDVNDNRPQFPVREVELEFAENSRPKDVKRSLPPARDLDRGQFGTQSYRIISGNSGGAFRLISHREKDDILYLDLQVSGTLDRETTPTYKLVIEASDGGSPSLKDQLFVKINILDLNDNEPVFSQSHYYGAIPENATIGTQVLRVSATDADLDASGRVTYSLYIKNSIAGSSSSSDSFSIDPASGVISVAKALDFESQHFFELVVIAQDSGSVSLETSAFVSIRITDIADSLPTVSLLLLTTNSKPEVLENARTGDLIARIALNDAQGVETTVASVELLGGDNDFGIKTSAGSSTPTFGLLLTVLSPLDRERRSHYSMIVILKDKNGIKCNASLELEILDVNDNTPLFDELEYHTTLPEAVDIGASVFQMRANDADSDSTLTYAFLLERTSGQESRAQSVDDEPKEEHSYLKWFNHINHTHRLASHTAWFSIEPRSGLIITRTQVDCETDSEPRLVIFVTDAILNDSNEVEFVGFSNTANLVVSISDINDNEPIFDQSFYNVTVREDQPVGACILQISATDPDCGVNALVNYSIASNVAMLSSFSLNTRSSFIDYDLELMKDNERRTDFELNSKSGQLCILRPLDFERQSLYDIPVLATDRGGLSTQAMIKIQILDTNDNFPVFYPREYKVNLNENALANRVMPIVIIAATDKDSGVNGQIAYSIERGNDYNLFEIVKNTGEIFLVHSLEGYRITEYRLVISARDGGGLISTDPAIVHISILFNKEASLSILPIFSQRSFNFEIIENCAPGSVVGVVRAHFTQQEFSDMFISYSIYSGDPDGYFSIDSRTGTISVSSPNLDRERHAYLLLNIQANNSGHRSSVRFAHTQVNITIIDENDNIPKFPASNIKISVSESVVNSSVIFVAQALDLDTGSYGTIRYSLYRAEGHSHLSDSEFPFIIEEFTGKVRLRKKLDFEIRSEYKLRVVAIDGGQLSSQMIVDLFVQDANDNSPIFIGASNVPSLDISALNSNLPSQNLPLFKLSVVENVQINSPIHQLKARDFDTGNNARLTFTIEKIDKKQSSSLPFDIFPNTGVIHVRDILDRESISSYYALVTVHDHGAPQQLNASAIVQITIEDANDNRPQWRWINYHFEISENAQIGSLVGTVQATDADLGLNSTLLYNFTETSTTFVGVPGDVTTFRLDSKTGQIFLAQSLDREIKSQYEMSVDVRDSGTPSLNSDERAIVTFKILDVNDNRPMFESESTFVLSSSTSSQFSEDDFEDLDDTDNQSIVRIPIGTLKGTIIATFKASDPDCGENGTVKYSLSDPNEMLEIDTDNGALMTKVDIREPKRGFRLDKLSIIATDGGGKRSRPKNVEIELIDRKEIHQINLDNAPSYEFSIPHDISQLNFGYRVGVLDLPSKRKNLCGNRFFTDFNHQYREKVPFFVDSDENKPSQLNLLTLNELNETNYSFLLCMDWSQCSTTLIHFNQRQYQQYHHLQLQCDHLTKIAVSQAHPQNYNCDPLNLDRDDQIYDIKISFVDLSESRNRLELLTLNHSNCKSVEYKLETPTEEDSSNYLNYFMIVPNNNVYILQFQLIDRSRSLSETIHELAHAYRELVFTLTAHWSVGSKSLSKSLPIRVKILSADKRLGNIVFMNDNHLELDEDCCRSGAAIFQARVNVSHDDFRVRYYLEHSTESEQFNLNPDSGLISLKREFDYEKRTQHQINITAMIYDAKSLIISVSQVFRVRVLNTNDEAPIFTEQKYSCEVQENNEIGAFCVRLIATDSDQPQSTNLTYLIAPGYEYNSLFHLNSRTGELTVVKSLDRERISAYDIPVYAFDQDNRYYAFKFVHLLVGDVNDNLPKFLSSNIEVHIPENVKIGTKIISLIIDDADSNPNGLKSTIISGNTGQRFVLQDNELYVNAHLDRESQMVYGLIINVNDDTHSVQANVTIMLDDINDNAPIFEKSDYYAILDLEGAYGWLPVVTVRAIDSDGDKLLYMIDTTVSDDEVPFNNLTKFFILNAETGEIAIHRSLIEPFFKQLPSKRFSFEVFAIEAGKNSYESHRSKTRVHLTFISDGRSSSNHLNHNGLKLTKYPFVIVADASRRSYRVGQDIGSINFVSGNFDQLKQSGIYQFQVLSGGESGRSFLDYFHLHSQTGTVSVKQPLDHNYYEAIIEVSHLLSNNSEATRTLVQIFIEELDKSKFVTPVSIEPLKISESFQIENELISLGRYVNLFSSQRYRFVLAYSNLKDFNSYFDIKPQNGRLQLKRSLDYETQPSRIELIAFAYSTSGSLYEYFHLFNFTIELLNVDDTLAQFSQSHYIGVVRESDQTGQIVGRVSAMDIDDQPNDGTLIGNRLNSRRFGYFIVEGNDDNAFSISADGFVRTNIVLDREIVEHYRLRIVATDMKVQDSSSSMTDVAFLADEANYQHLTQCLFEVIVIDVNDNTPVFPPKFEISVSEDASPGSLVGSTTANDVDIYPVLMYDKKKGTPLEDTFDIGRFTGKITLKRSLTQYLKWQPEELVRPIELSISASDGLNFVQTKVIVNIKRNISKMTPIFNEHHFIINIDLDSDFVSLTNEINIEIFRFDVKKNSMNRKIIYRMESLFRDPSDSVFFIDRNRGIVYNNRTIRSFRQSKLYQLIIMAKFEDADKWIRMSLFVNVERSLFGLRKSDFNTVTFSGHHQLEIDADQVGVALLRLPKLIHDQYIILGGNNNKNFIILRGCELHLNVRPLTDHYTLKIGRSTSLSSGLNTTMFIHIKIRSGSSAQSQAQTPFKSSVFELEIDESEHLNSAIQSLKYSHVKEEYEFKIFAGNEERHFRVHSTDGILLVNGPLDYETLPRYRLGIVAISKDRTYFAIVNIVLNNINEFCPRFPSNFFKAIIQENSLPGTKVIPIRAIDEDRESLNYTVTKLATSPQDDDNKRDVFQYDSNSGYLVVSGLLDYEQNHQSTQHVHKYVVRVADLAMAITHSGLEMRCASVETLLEIQVGSVDEFAPKFSQETYNFKLTNSLISNKNRMKIGQVEASDSDAGPDGLLQFSIKNVSPTSLFDCVQINSTSGVLSLLLNRLRKKIAIKKSGLSVLPKQFSIVIIASSGRVNSLSSLAVVDVTVGTVLFDEQILDNVDEDEESENLNSIDSDSLGSIHKEAVLPGWLVFLTVLLLLVTVVLVVSIVVIRQAQTQQYLAGHYPPRQPGGHVGSLFRKIGPFINSGPSNQIMEPNALSPAYSTTHYGNVSVSLSPPCYNEININSNAICNGVANSHNGTQSLVLSTGSRGAEQSSSSGRGSAEEEEVDEEIRMINESSNYYTTGPEDDVQEEGEIPTTAEYLARLGVVNHYEEPENVSSLGEDDDDEQQFSETRRRLKRKKIPRVVSSYSQYCPSSSGQISSNNVQPQIGSVNSLVMQQLHNGEEIAGSYNWDYLQHWGPKYQPLSSVFSEIARLKASESEQHISSMKNLESTQNTEVDKIRNFTQSHSSSSRVRSVHPQTIVSYQHFYELPPQQNSPIQQIRHYSKEQQQTLYQPYTLRSQASSNSNHSTHGLTSTSNGTCALQRINETAANLTLTQLTSDLSAPQNVERDHRKENHLHQAGGSSSSQTSSIYNKICNKYL